MAMSLSTRGILLLSAALTMCSTCPLPPTEFFIRNRNTQKCINVSGNPGTADGSAIQIWDCQFFQSGTDQLWKMDDANRIVSVVSGKCIDVGGDRSSANGVELLLYSCQTQDGSTSDHEWELNFHDATYFRIKNRDTGKCLDVLGDVDTDNGAVIQQQDCESFCKADSDQWWEMVPKDSLPNLGFCVPV